ncbi:MAG TPA: hypothetical protein VGQ85_07040 [Candidatus Limnocylindrales bacterium]|nr:hypothetical protein [Candidatus Limnocylindrales bacterium]
MTSAPQVTRVADAAELAAALGPRPEHGRAIALIGGADRMDGAATEAIEQFFANLAFAVDGLGASLVDGGTDSGVMRLIGAARSRAEGSFRLIGVAPAGTLERDSRTGHPIRLAEDHPEIILVPGDRFGDETASLFAAADYLGSGGAATIVVNGGRLTFDEAVQRMTSGRTVIAVAGTGRAADVLAGGPVIEGIGPLAADLVAGPLLRVVPLTLDVAEIAATLESSFAEG